MPFNDACMGRCWSWVLVVIGSSQRTRYSDDQSLNALNDNFETFSYLFNSEKRAWVDPQVFMIGHWRHNRSILDGYAKRSKKIVAVDVCGQCDQMWQSYRWQTFIQN